ncbi:MAG: SusE domain-containing protein [Chitinophagaceae bacterium]
MKYLSKIFFLIIITATMFTSCKKDENQVYYTGGTEPVLKSSVAANTSLTLTEADKDLVAMKLWWTNPNYKFTTGVSSQDVTYTIEIDTTGSNFSSPNKKEVSLTADLMKEITVGDLNRYLVADMKLKAGENHPVEIRLKSSLNGSAALYSNVFKYTIKPYLVVKVALPSSGDLFIIGGATPGGWPNPVPEPSQKFTKVSSAVYEITITLTGGESYLLLPVNGSWSDKYGGVGTSNNSNNVDGDDFKRGGSDLKAPPVTGNYKITVDFQEGKFKLVKL